MKRGPVLAGAVGVALLLIVFLGLIMPKASAIKAKHNEIEQAQQQQTQLQVQLRELRDDARRAEEANQKLAELDREIPPTADLPGIIRMLNEAADSAAVDFMSLAPAQPTGSPDGKTSIIPTQIVVRGGFFAVDQFLYELEHLPRVARVLSISVGGSGGVGTLDATLSANFYTIDTSAGPGSVPGPSSGSDGTPATTGTATTPGA